MAFQIGDVWYGKNGTVCSAKGRKNAIKTAPIHAQLVHFDGYVEHTLKELQNPTDWVENNK